MRFNHINNVTIIAVLSFVLAVLGFILDLHERVQDVKVNIFETLMVTAIIFTALSTLYVLGFVLFKICKNYLLRKGFLSIRENVKAV